MRPEDLLKSMQQHSSITDEAIHAATKKANESLAREIDECCTNLFKDAQGNPQLEELAKTLAVSLNCTKKIVVEIDDPGKGKEFIWRSLYLLIIGTAHEKFMYALKMEKKMRQKLPGILSL